MKEKTWKLIAIILIILISTSFLFFLIKAYIEYKFIQLSKIPYTKSQKLNYLLWKNNITKKFKKKSVINRKELTEILWAGYGKTKNKLKTVYSFLEYPLYIYIITGKDDVEKLKPSAYKYISNTQNLERIISDNIKNKIIKTFDFKGHVPLILLISCSQDEYDFDLEKIFFEVGEVTAHIILKAKELKLKVNLVDNFDEKTIRNILKLKNEKPLLILLIGK